MLLCVLRRFDLHVSVRLSLGKRGHLAAVARAALLAHAGYWPHGRLLIGTSGRQADEKGGETLGRCVFVPDAHVDQDRQDLRTRQGDDAAGR